MDMINDEAKSSAQPAPTRTTVACTPQLGRAARDRLMKRSAEWELRGALARRPVLLQHELAPIAQVLKPETQRPQLEGNDLFDPEPTIETSIERYIQWAVKQRMETERKANDDKLAQLEAVVTRQTSMVERVRWEIREVSHRVEDHRRAIEELRREIREVFDRVEDHHIDIEGLGMAMDRQKETSDRHIKSIVELQMEAPMGGGGGGAKPHILSNQSGPHMP
ncbi:hypothetical protein AAL_08164 [Moelleriella libera RCEF 2490]|uniref:Uncharacterized protein n=1 Tax=Moelleriella libera RCEF 2490 TaxID=1081109 RepID=A0A162IF22_9HYPO|nr:hypothetical protein AAL_08164 [Moelleriella libera RCEF 2490]